MPRKAGGRPPIHPRIRVSRPVRALVTPVIEEALIAASEIHGIEYVETDRGIVTVPSDILRLYVYRGLVHDGVIDNAEDNTFRTLRESGLV